MRTGEKKEGEMLKAKGLTQEAGGKYEPTVSVSTREIDGHISIYVKDNVSGIPQNVVDKIFQHFLLQNRPEGEQDWDYHWHI
jgi:DNA topoisomerase VI subunit B